MVNGERTVDLEREKKGGCSRHKSNSCVVNACITHASNFCSPVIATVLYRHGLLESAIIQTSRPDRKVGAHALSG